MSTSFATLERLIAIRSQAAEAMLDYLRRLVTVLWKNPLLDNFDIQKRLDDVRQPLRVVPFEPDRHREEAVFTEHLRPARERYAFGGGQDQPRRLLTEVEPGLDQAILLADPGAGKTEWLKYQARQAASKALEALEKQTINLSEIGFPVFLRLDEVGKMLGRNEEEKKQQKEVLRGFLVRTGCIEAAVESIDDARCVAAAMLKVLVEHRDYRLSERLVHFVWRQWLEKSSKPVAGEKDAVSAQPLLCLDAWDEVRTGQDILAGCLYDFARISACRIFITSRIAGYNHRLLPEGENDRAPRREWRVCPFEWDEATVFLSMWFDNDPGRGRRMLDELRDKVAMWGLVCNPLMATLLCLAFSPVSRQRSLLFPVQRGAVYERVLWGLLGEWRRQRVAPQQRAMTDEEKKRIEKKLNALAYVAWHFFQKGRERFTRTELEKAVQAYLGTDDGTSLLAIEVFRLSQDVMLRLALLPEAKRQEQAAEAVAAALCGELIESDGVLVRKSEDEKETDYGFLHLTFQEYLAAQEIHRSKRTSVLAAHFGYDAWREVTLLCAGIGDASGLVEGILALPGKTLAEKEHWRFLREILSEACSLDKVTQIRLLDRLNADDPHEAAKAAICLRSMSGATISVLDVDILIERFEAIRDDESLAKGHLALLLGEKGLEEGKEEVLQVLLPYLEKGDSHVKYLAAVALDILGYEDRQALDDVLMVKIPKGSFIMGGKGYKAGPHRTVETGAYLMDRFPLTNGQYRKFIEAGGYQKHRVSEPLFWHDPEFNVLSAPVVGITWYEAEAYGKWAGKELPEETLWERAARGDVDAREYPWGDEFDGNRCNANMVIGQPTPVGSYPDGVSPNGCYDMAGNVWEWTISEYKTVRYKACIVRGGSWCYNPGLARCSSRVDYHPSDRVNRCGVRFSRTF